MRTLSPRAGYDLWAAGYGEKQNPVQVLEEEALLQVLPELRGRSVLDLGCGKGRAGALAARRGASLCVGLDFSSAMLKAAANRPGTSYVAGDALFLPFRAHSFDVVISALMMGHVADLQKTLVETSRVTRPEGVLAISDFHPYATVRGWQRTFVDFRSGREYVIEQHLHLFEHYLECFNQLSIQVEELREPLHEGFPLVFAMRARKTS